MESIQIARNYRQSTQIRRDRSPDRLKNRITCAYSPAERAAIEWLNRTPPIDDLPQHFAELRGKPRREIAKQLNAATLAELVTIHARFRPQPPQ